MPPLEYDGLAATASPASTRSARRRTPRRWSATSPPGLPQALALLDSTDGARGRPRARCSPPRRRTAPSDEREVTSTERRRRTTCGAPRRRRTTTEPPTSTVDRWTRPTHGRERQRADGGPRPTTHTGGTVHRNKRRATVAGRAVGRSASSSPPRAAATTTTTPRAPRRAGPRPSPRAPTSPDTTTDRRAPSADRGDRAGRPRPTAPTTTEPRATAPSRRPGERHVTEDEGEPVQGGTLVYGIEADTANAWAPLPRRATRRAATSRCAAVTDSLFAVNDEGETVPLLVETVEPNADYTEWTLTIQEGITFHDGTPLDGAAVKFNIDACRAAPLTGRRLRADRQRRRPRARTSTITTAGRAVGRPAGVLHRTARAATCCRRSGWAACPTSRSAPEGRRSTTPRWRPRRPTATRPRRSGSARSCSSPTRRATATRSGRAQRGLLAGPERHHR